MGFTTLIELTDPEGLLEGTGKNMRHLKIKKMEDIDEGLIKRVVRSNSEVKKPVDNKVYK